MFIVKEQPEFIVTLTLPPVLPEEGTGEQDPPIVQVKEGAPPSATVTLIGTVTDAALAGLGRTIRTKRNAHAARNPIFAALGSICLPF